MCCENLDWDQFQMKAQSLDCCCFYCFWDEMFPFILLFRDAVDRAVEARRQECKARTSELTAVQKLHQQAKVSLTTSCCNSVGLVVRLFASS